MQCVKLELDRRNQKRLAGEKFRNPREESFQEGSGLGF